MSFEITFSKLPIGYAAKSSKANDNKVEVVCREFSSSEDGDMFISRLEGYPSEIIRKLPKEYDIKESQVDHLVAIIKRDLNATVYINEVNFIAEYGVKRSIKAGEKIYIDDISDVKYLKLKDIVIPNDAGFVFLFSVGWRKFLYFDLLPILHENSKIRDYDPCTYFAKFFSYLLFQNRFKLTEAEWDRLIMKQWFPFITLSERTLNDIINHNRELWDIDELLPKIKDELLRNLPKMIERWKLNNYFKLQIPFLEKAMERYIDDDHLSCSSILFPRIEGVMRSVQSANNGVMKATQTNLIQSIVKKNYISSNSLSPLLPKKFREYLEKVYFADFDPKGEKPFSRHTVSHGVADVKDFSLKSSTIGFLVLDHICFFTRNKNQINYDKKREKQESID